MHWPLRRRWPWITLSVIAVVLVGIRLALPSWVTDYLNSKLNRMGDYHGHIDAVDLQLWRGAYSITGLRITKSAGKVPVSLLEAPRTDLSISWRALLDGGVVASVEFQGPKVNFVDSEGKATQSGTGVDWRQQVEKLIPIRLDEVRVHNGVVHFRNFSTDPKVDLEATGVEARVLNLTNVRDAGARAADFKLTAHVLGQAPLESQAKFDPFGSLKDFDFKLQLKQVELKRLNKFLQAYLKLDVESGKGEFVMELEGRNGQLDGYAKPLFHDVQVFSWKHDVEKQGDNPLRAVWEAVAGGIENLFKNQSTDQFATRVEIHGRIGDAKTSTWQAIIAILHNAFVKAYRPQLEGLPTRGADDTD